MPLLIVMLALTLLLGLGTTLVVGTMTETTVAAAYRQGVEAFYAADAAVELAIADLAARPDWDEMLSGAATSALVDGPPEGTRRLGATVIDLITATAEVEALLAARATPPAGAAQLYAYGPIDWLLPEAGGAPPLYVCVWLAERASGADDDPPGRSLYLVGRAYGATGGRRTVLVAVSRPSDGDDPPLQVRSWEEPR